MLHVSSFPSFPLSFVLYFCETRRSYESTAAPSGIHVSDVWYLLEAISEEALLAWIFGVQTFTNSVTIIQTK